MCKSSSDFPKCHEISPHFRHILLSDNVHIHNFVSLLEELVILFIRTNYVYPLYFVTYSFCFSLFEDADPLSLVICR